MVISEDLAICVACSTQFDVPLSQHPKACKICDDPRQFVPPTGQEWTSLAKLKSEAYHNIWKPDPHDHRIQTFSIEPKVGIGQRAILLKTAHGNVLWDLVAYIDEETINAIQINGGLKAIVISHPHYYSTHLDWARTFNCPIYISAEDQEWLCRADDFRHPARSFITDTTQEILPGVTAIKAGGHFPGSLVLHWENKLFIADTMVTVPSGLYHIDRLPGTTSYSFMWSIPNMIPLSPLEIERIWQRIEPFEWEETYGAFNGLDIRGKGKDVKARMLESMKIQVRSEGHDKHPLLEIELQ